MAEREVEQSRLISVIEYAQNTARMQSKPVSSVAAHGLFALWENDAQSRPGLHVNPDAAVEDDERWLVIKRLQQTAAPTVEDLHLKAWIEAGQSPQNPPRLKHVAYGRDLIAAGTHREKGKQAHRQELPEVDPNITITFDEYAAAPEIRTAFETYESKLWRPWADRERAVRETIALYSKLFTLKQQFEEGIVEQALELVWGVGVGVWDSNESRVTYPLITRLVELTLNEATGAIEIRPRDLPAHLELEWYAAVDNSGVTAVEKAGKEFFQQAALTVSPFDRGSFEPLLRSAVTHLDSNGLYWPDVVCLRTGPFQSLKHRSW